jgi:hypothetical protein
MAWRRLVVVLLLASASAAALAQTAPTPSYVPERETNCWDCHAGAPQGSSPPVATFLSIEPPETAGARVGEPFAYKVSVRNAWTSDLTYLEPRLDLTQAPSLSFAAKIPDFQWQLAGNVTTDLARPTQAYAQAVPVEVAAGLTRLTIVLAPEDTDPLTGPDLALKVENGGFSMTLDRQGRGGAEALNLTRRDEFATFGYGNWTVSAVATPVRTDPAALLNSTLPRPAIPFRLDVAGGATDTADRILGLPSRELLAGGAGVVAVFDLVPTATPGPGERVTLEVRAHAHYEHLKKTDNDQDDADLVKALGEPILVVADGDQVRLASTAVAPVVPAVHNGASMATVAEAVGYASAFLLLASTTAGGMFGKASRRWANGVFGSARRRVAFHNFLSYGLILAALAHTVLFLVEAAYGWAIGLVWGGLAGLCMLGLGLTGALQVPMIRRWSFGAWRWTHYALAVGTLAFTVAHMALDGAHFTAVQEWLGWRDPVAGALS